MKNKVKCPCGKIHRCECGSDEHENAECASNNTEWNQLTTNELKGKELWSVGPISRMTTNGIYLPFDHSQEAKILSDIIILEKYDELQGIRA